MLAHQGTVERSNADGYRCIDSNSVSILEEGQGGAIFPMEDTNLQELKKITRSESCGLAKGVAI